jgi:hypothetical protein
VSKSERLAWSLAEDVLALAGEHKPAVPLLQSAEEQLLALNREYET